MCHICAISSYYRSGKYLEDPLPTPPNSILGSSFGGNPLSKSLRENIEEKIHKKLNNGKYANISKGGRLTLINASLYNMPTYQLSVFKVLVSVYKVIEKHWRDFLWKCANEATGSNITNWSKVTSPNNKGGLGITNSRSTNFAFLNK